MKVTLESDFFVTFGANDDVWHVFVSTEGAVTAEHSVGELTPHELKMHWEEVSTGVRKEMLSFSDLGVFKISPHGTTGNAMTSRWVIRWKMNLLTNVMEIKARLTVRGFLDREADTLATFAGTASRWGPTSHRCHLCSKWLASHLCRRRISIPTIPHFR